MTAPSETRPRAEPRPGDGLQPRPRAHQRRPSARPGEARRPPAGGPMGGGGVEQTATPDGPSFPVLPTSEHDAKPNQRLRYAVSSFVDARAARWKRRDPSWRRSPPGWSTSSPNAATPSAPPGTKAPRAPRRRRNCAWPCAATATSWSGCSTSEPSPPSRGVSCRSCRAPDAWHGISRPRARRTQCPCALLRGLRATARPQLPLGGAP